MTGIVVGVDGSTCAAHALTWAAREAELHHWRLRVVLAWDLLDQHHVSLAERFDPHYSEAKALEALDTYVARAFDPASPPAALQRITVCDLPARALLESSTDASLLVVGARGRGGIRELLLGSVSQHCVHHATCPVAIVRPGIDVSERSDERIVVGVDGSANARRALEWALREAVARHAVLEIVHAWHVPYGDGYPYPIASSDPDAFESAARAVVADSVAGLDTAGLDTAIERSLVMDNPGPALVQAAKDAALIVVGSRGRGGVGSLLGSVSHHVSHHATCPVVIVPPQLP